MNHHPAVRKRTNKVVALVAAAALSVVGGMSLAGCSADNKAPSEADSTQSEESTEGTATDELGGTLQIYAAASLKGAFDTLVEEFSAEHPNLTVSPTVYDGSSTLVTQILEGAPVDVFASADERNMDTLVEADMAGSEPQIFATNKITIAVPAGNPENITSLGDLANPDLSVVLCAEDVPCGGAARSVLDAAGVTVTPVSNEQNVTAVATKVASGEADAGLVYVTDVQASDGALESIEIPLDDEFINKYPIAVVKDSSNEGAADVFIHFVLSDRGQEILREFGFGAP